MPNGSPHGVTAPDAIDIRERRLDASFSIPMANRRLWAAIRAVAMLSAGVILLVTPGVGHPRSLAAILAGGALLHPIAIRFGRGRDVSRLVAAGDILVATSVATLMPTLFPAAAIWVGTLLTWQAITSPTRAAAAIGALALSATTAAGYLGDIASWWMIAITQALLTAAYLVFGHALRSEVVDNEVDLLATVSIGGVIVHRTGLHPGTARQVHGDVQGLTGYTKSEWLAIDHRSIVHPDDVENYWIDADDVRANAIIDRVGRVRRADGTWMWLRDVSRVTMDSSGRPTLRGFAFDVTEAQEGHAEMRRQARLDSMTGLPNRLALHEEMASRLERCERFALLLVDLDRFKAVNDTLGHEAGDHVLTVIATRLSQVIGPRDHLTRMGGDEFAILIDGATERTGVRSVEDAIAAVCREPVDIRGISLALSSSTGVAFATSESHGATVLRHADIAMYAAKSVGESSRVFDASLEQTDTFELSLTAALPRAIERGEVELHFQPQFDLRTRRLVSAEGLVRWRHPELGLLTPDTFLDIALMSECSDAFVRATVEQTITMIRRSCDIGYPIRGAVNVSIASLHDLDFADNVFELLDRHHVPAHDLILEITENDAGGPTDDILRTLNRLSAEGIAISIDDFGTGHSSLERLRTLRVDEIKLDRMFVGGMVTDERDRNIASSIIELAGRLGISVVAEGVERHEQAELLVRMGCRFAQGFLFAAALEPTRFDALVMEHASREPTDQTEPAGGASTRGAREMATDLV